MKNLEKSQWVAILTGAIALILSFSYLLLVQFLDFRGEMLPAPQSYLSSPSIVATLPHPLQREAGRVL